MSYNYETHKNSPNFTPASKAKASYGMTRVVEGITIHHWGDPNQNPQFDNIVNYLCRANGNTSAHYVASGTGRRVSCIVGPNDVAWHGGTAWANARTIGIELDPRARDEDYDVAAELIADIRSAYGDVPIYWHSYFKATACPGKWSPERLDKLSYTKYSHATAWGQGGTKVEHLPKPEPTATTVPAPVPTPTPVFEPNVPEEPATPEQQVPSPTSGQPDSGKPVAEKDDYKELVRGRLTTLFHTFLDFIFKIFTR
jgi:hypothetical protein